MTPFGWLNDRDKMTAATGFTTFILNPDTLEVTSDAGPASVWLKNVDFYTYMMEEPRQGLPYNYVPQGTRWCNDCWVYMTIDFYNDEPTNTDTGTGQDWYEFFVHVNENALAPVCSFGALAAAIAVLAY